MVARAPTRSLRKEATRQRLLRAALAVVAEKGFASASLADIAERAGVTTGAVYSNFRSKEALLLDLVDWQMEGSPEDPAIYPRAGDPDKPVVEHLVDTAIAAGRYADTVESRRLVVLQVELLLLALRDRSVRRELRSGGRNLTRGLAHVFDQLGKVPSPGPPPSLEQLAEIYYACVQGLQQHRLLAPELAPDELFEWAVKALLFAASEGIRHGRSRAPSVRKASRRVTAPRTR